MIMKEDYLKPEILEIEMVTAEMVLGGSADTGLDETPDIPDTNKRRGTWGNLWE